MTKIIHYCWFGSPVPEAVKRNVENWSRLNPDFEIREWNDSNCDVSNTNSEEERGQRGDGDLWLILFVLISYMNSEGGMLTRMLK